MKSVLPVITVIIVLAACIALPVSAAVYYSASTPQIITRGDAFSVSGTGATNGTVALWVIGRNYFEVRTVAPDRHGNFSLFFKPTETIQFSTGQYAVVLQDPGPNGIMEIEAGRDSGGNLTIMNRGKIIVRLGTKEALMSNVQKETASLTAAAGLQGVDDSFREEFFFIEEPNVQFNGIIPASDSRLPDQASGSRILFNGTTNLRTIDTFRAEISNADTKAPVTTKDLAIIPGVSLNSWSYQLDEPGLEPGNYLISVGWSSYNTTGTSTARFAVRGESGPAFPAGPVPTVIGDVPLRDGLDTLLILGIVFVFAVVVYTVGKK
ncbi:MAG: hypothetical protein LUQ71_04740 [Methanoregula sp.]|nr:hypothetical protein [Methanoregula sp.]